MTKINSDDEVYGTEINVEGVVSERKQAAVEEIRWYLELFNTISREFRLEVQLRRIVVADDFDATIKELWPVCRASGIEYKVEYKAQRHTVRTAAKVVRHIENGELSFSVVFNSESFGSWEERAKGSRFVSFFHEFYHTIMDRRRFKRVGAENFYPGEKTAEGVCLSLAMGARDEYIVDRLMDELCPKFLSDSNGRPMNLADVCLAEGIDLRESLLELVKKMGNFVRQSVKDFREWRLTIDILWPRMLQFIEELLDVFAHCAATYDQREEWRKLLEDISSTEAYKSILSEHLEVIHTEYKGWFDKSDCDDVASLNIIGREIKEILRKCGLTLIDVPEGIYVKVNFV